METAVMSGQLTNEGYEHDDGTLVEFPDDDGRIRIRDQHGNTVHWTDPGDDDYAEYLAVVTPS